MLKRPPLIIDNCVLGNLHSAKGLYLLDLLYPGEIIIPSQVLEEATLKSGLYQELKLLKEREVFQIYTIDDISEMRRFAKLERRFKDNGEAQAKGEAAVLTIAEITEGTVCSDNISDVKSYIDRHNMELKTTLGIIFDAYSEKIIDQIQGEEMIKNIINDGNKIPVSTFEEVINWFENEEGRKLF